MFSIKNIKFFNNKKIFEKKIKFGSLESCIILPKINKIAQRAKYAIGVKHNPEKWILLLA